MHCALLLLLLFFFFFFFFFLLAVVAVVVVCRCSCYGLCDANTGARQANLQIGFVSGSGAMPSAQYVTFAVYTNVSVYSQHHKAMDRGYTHATYEFAV